ncbi:Lrp/AsnC family transcriptional regulator [Pseudoclavibacter caeni]|jgi:Lrp/AsnC family leucine-responsive transcriptional regulator|uniref:AsnC family transcriptional regulator n=1 Tax=Pseudoclavibacter caeni TaxID=908846 RepID=A0A7C8BPC7_9MICO|nr:AsnC family transcriptional regulator [Pseudoclavibacter caeni]KAB1633707.1 AsnC family transcriptional regulator [Pseudoclavibacter caeni]NYJ96268.1 Lrp/AsnC family leucine-responsive transcriptional regulator [Pseudoclavibacter caeni]
MDDIDRSILAVLATDGRATLSTLSAASGLSTSAVQSRVQRLERSAVIRGYRAVIDQDAIGLPLTAFVEIAPLDPAAPDDAPDRLEDVDGVEACYSIAGDASYLLLVRVPRPSDLEGLLQRIRTAANVSTRTRVVLRTYFEGRPVPPPAAV